MGEFSTQNKVGITKLSPICQIDVGVLKAFLFGRRDGNAGRLATWDIINILNLHNMSLV